MNSVMEGGEPWLPREYRASNIFAHMRQVLAGIDERKRWLADARFSANARLADDEVWQEAYLTTINETGELT